MAARQSKQPNHRLRTLLAEASWSGQDLARAVNRAGREAGLEPTYDRTSVAHWLRGACPPPAIRALVAEAFSRALGRTVTAADAGLAAAPADGLVPDGPAPTRPAPSGGWPRTVADAAAVLAELGAPPARGRDALRSTAYRAAPWDLPSAHPCPEPPARPAGPGTAGTGAARVRAARAAWESFAEVHAASGGGLGRDALAGYLATSIAPWLDAPAAPAHLHRLVRCAAGLAHLAGLMCHDGNLHGAAQAYYGVTARLAAATGDLPGHAAALTAMSVQAHDLGHPAYALALARAAAEQAPHLTDRQHARIRGQSAVAAAGCGDRDGAFAQLRAARALLASVAAGPGGPDGQAAAVLAQQEAELLAALGDRGAAIAAGTRALGLRARTQRGARAVAAARLAELHLDQGNVEAACALWRELLDDYPYLRSARVDVALGRTRRRLHRHRATSGAVRELFARLPRPGERFPAALRADGLLPP